MSDPKHNEASDEALGLNASIDRRDLLNSTLLAAGGLLLNAVSPFELLAQEDWTGYGGVGDYANSNGNTYDVMTAGHRIGTVYSSENPSSLSTRAKSSIAF
jgi:spermidine dehydrogenase